MRLAQPPGVRSCSTGGEWEFCRDAANGGSHWQRDLQRLLHNATPVHGKMLRAELYDLMTRAAKGQLVYGRHEHVEQMATALSVLELRLTSRLGDEKGEQIVRLYFTEPDDHARMLLALKVAGKRPGPMITDEQNTHAADASRRADHYILSV